MKILTIPEESEMSVTVFNNNRVPYEMNADFNYD